MLVRLQNLVSENQRYNLVDPCQLIHFLFKQLSWLKWCECGLGFNGCPPMTQAYQRKHWNLAWRSATHKDYKRIKQFNNLRDKVRLKEQPRT